MRTNLFPTFCLLVAIQAFSYVAVFFVSWDCHEDHHRRRNNNNNNNNSPSHLLANALRYELSGIAFTPDRMAQLEYATAMNPPLQNHHHHHSWKVPRRDNRTAVVVTVPYVDECDAVRLQHLVDTSGMDVWVLHGHDALRSVQPEWVEESERLLASIPGLYSWPQVERQLENFDSKVSGSTKSSYLKFLIHHQGTYDFAWHVESDVFFTGQWKQVLGNGNDNGNDYGTADLIYAKQWPKNEGNDTNWWTKVGNGTCVVDGESCLDILPWQTYWMVIRTSWRLAHDMVRSLEDGQVTGHHEAVLASFCTKRGFSTRQIPPKLFGQTFHCGTSVPYKDRQAERRLNTLSRNAPPEPEKLYHPVKCEAYTSGYVMKAEIEQWLL